MNDVFVCLDVESDFNCSQLSKRLDDLFPGKIIRLKINGEFSPFFYLGNGEWKYKGRYKKNIFSAKIYLEDDMRDFLEDKQIALLEYLNFNLDNFKFINDTFLGKKEIPGIFFTDGTYIIMDQCLIDGVNALSDFLIKHFECSTFLDVTNDLETGFLILKSNTDIFGINNDKSNTKAK